LTVLLQLFVTFVRRDCYHSGNPTVTQRFEFRETDISKKKDAELTPSEMGGDDPAADPVTRRMLPTASKIAPLQGWGLLPGRPAASSVR
jgi:hypothetical protein